MPELDGRLLFARCIHNRGFGIKNFTIGSFYRVINIEKHNGTLDIYTILDNNNEVFKTHLYDKFLGFDLFRKVEV